MRRVQEQMLLKNQCMPHIAESLARVICITTTTAITGDSDGNTGSKAGNIGRNRNNAGNGTTVAAMVLLGNANGEYGAECNA